jgi:hypothetical protein
MPIDPETRDTIRFLVGRLAGDHGDRGMSSDALIVSAVRGTAPTSEPVDLADFGRCCEAFALAPWSLKERMLPTLAKWCNEMVVKYDAAKEGDHD